MKDRDGNNPTTSDDLKPEAELSDAEQAAGLYGTFTKVILIMIGWVTFAGAGLIAVPLYSDIVAGDDRLATYSAAGTWAICAVLGLVLVGVAPLSAGLRCGCHR